MNRCFGLLLALLVLAALPSAPLRVPTAAAATVCTTAKKCTTITTTVGRAWSEGSDPLNVTRYDVKVDATGLPAGTLLYSFEHMADGTFGGGMAMAKASTSGRAQGTVSPICPSWYVGTRPDGGKIVAYLPSGEFYERWTAPAC
jgi:hypothetical protein